MSNEMKMTTCLVCLIIIRDMAKQKEIIIYGFIAHFLSPSSLCLCYNMLFVILTEGCVKCRRGKKVHKGELCIAIIIKTKI